MSSRLIASGVAAALVLGTSVPVLAAPAKPARAAQAEPLHVAVIWHQHQPQYPKAPGANVYEQPWVRLHGTKDYYDMTHMVREFPGLKLTVNLTPVLLQQIEDYNKGATDRHFVLAAKPADRLTAAEKPEAHRRFFQVSAPMMTPFPRFAELKRKPMANYSTQDWRDLQVLFHLAWTDTMFRNAGPLAAITRKGRNFTEADKRVLLAEHRRIMTRIIPLHTQLQREGRIEVATTPFFHPILPLIHDTALAKEAMPHAPMPSTRMRRPEDANFHVTEAVRYYRRLFGQAPRGMWPGEGSVAQAVAPAFKAAGIRWIATDEEVLGKSLKLNLRDGEKLTKPDVLYQPYQVPQGPAIVFRDRKLSDDIGFRYSKMRGEDAAKDLLGQLKAAAKSTQGPRLVSIILDGENAWENYPDDGKAFLRALYRGLTTDPAFKTTTPSEYLRTHTPRPLPRLWAGSWIQASYSTWIGEEEENAAWELLTRARDAVEVYGRQKGRRDPGYLKAMGKIYAAEGSDWFWWYGQDQDSGRDEEFDAAFRRLLSNAYGDIGQKPPGALAIPLIQAGARPTREPKAYLNPTLDGVIARQEWADAGSLFAQGGAMNVGDQKVAALFYGWNKENLVLAIQYNGEARPFKLHLGIPGKPGGVQQSEAGFFSHFEADVDPAEGYAALSVAGKSAPFKSSIDARGGRDSAELVIPWTALGVRSGEPLLLSLKVEGDRPFPTAPLKIQVPILGIRPVVTLEDAPDPGIGPGSYTLPTGNAYTRESVDLKRLTIADRGDRWAFTWQLGQVRNPWGSPIGLSLVSLDLYLALAEEDGELTALLPERKIQATRPWAYALSIEGWQQGLYRADGQKIADVTVAVDPLSNEVRAFVPKSLIQGQPAYWSYLAVLSGQDGFSPGRIRQVLKNADADHFGGRPDDNYPQVLDILLPADLPQDQVLVPSYGQVVVPYLNPSGKVEGTE